MYRQQKSVGALGEGEEPVEVSEGEVRFVDVERKLAV